MEKKWEFYETVPMKLVRLMKMVSMKAIIFSV
jgi:hypothetical protein